MMTVFDAGFETRTVAGAQSLLARVGDQDDLAGSRQAAGTTTAVGARGRAAG